jgi:hypothetical protein
MANLMAFAPVLILLSILVIYLYRSKRSFETRGVRRIWIGRNIICPNPRCDYQGPARRVARGSFLVGFILLCLFILPGLLYFMLKSGYRYYCPKCGLQVGADN